MRVQILAPPKRRGENKKEKRNKTLLDLSTNHKKRNKFGLYTKTVNDRGKGNSKERSKEKSQGLGGVASAVLPQKDLRKAHASTATRELLPG